MVVPEGSLVVGSPARVLRPLTAEEQAANAQLALKYVEISRRYLSLSLGEAAGGA
jgi:carbonic anhydrase/acetyltransferase-like protein (isoleucine patch superfamily)